MSHCLVQLRAHDSMAAAKRTSIAYVWFTGGAPGGDTV